MASETKCGVLMKNRVNEKKVKLLKEYNGLFNEAVVVASKIGTQPSEVKIHHVEELLRVLKDMKATAEEIHNCKEPKRKILTGAHPDDGQDC